MVRHHLLLPDVATRRDLSDDVTIDAVAEAVGDARVLELLAALTEADSLATGPSAWGTWKSELVAELADRVRFRLGSGAAMPESWSLFPSAEVLALMGSGRLALLPEPDRITVVAPDRPGLFTHIAGVLTLHGLDVLGAQAHSDELGMAASEFRVATEGEPRLGARRARPRAVARRAARPGGAAGRAGPYLRPPANRQRPAGHAAASRSTTRRRRTPRWWRSARPTASACSTASARRWPTSGSTSATPASRRSGTRWSTRSTCGRRRRRKVDRRLPPRRGGAGAAPRRVRGLTGRGRSGGAAAARLPSGAWLKEQSPPTSPATCSAGARRWPASPAPAWASPRTSTSGSATRRC